MLYYNGYIFREKQGFVYGGFTVEGERFQEILEGNVGESFKAGIADGVDLKGAYVIPGLVDIHIHGCVGADASDGNIDGLRRMKGYLAGQGVTSFLPTTMTLPYEALHAAFSTIESVQKEKQGARILGIHMEGPYLSEKKKGSQNAAYLKKPDVEKFLELWEACGKRIRIVDVAPELEGAWEFVRRISKCCVVSAAHTDTDYEAANAFYEAGASHLAHLYNAMPPFHHRSPGVIGAASERKNVTAELICDGIHVHPSAVRLAFSMFPERICLVSDALRCLGMPDGAYELGGQRVELRGAEARLLDRTLAGSATGLFDCMKKAMAFGVEPEAAIRAASCLPARVAGMTDVGGIEPGKYADFVLCDQSFGRKAVYLGGKVVSLLSVISPAKV